MKSDLFLLSEAMALTEMMLDKADRVFCNRRRMMEEKYHLRHGIFMRA